MESSLNPAPRVVIVTGAASGIGRHWGEVLASRGDAFRLVLTDVNAEGLRAAFTPGDRIHLHAFDVRCPDQWRAMVADALTRFGRIDYLFNIAGGGSPGFLLKVPEAVVDTTIDLNLKGPIHGMRAVGTVMVKQGSGHIINVSSLAGIAATPGNELYAAAKSGLRSVSLSSAVRLRPHGVFVTVVCPDLVDTPTLTRHLSLPPEDVAIIHSGPGALTVNDVARAFDKVMHSRPVEISLPGWRGWLAKINNLFPPLMFRFYGPLMRRGLKRLEEVKRERQVASVPPPPTVIAKAKTAATLTPAAGVIRAVLCSIVRRIMRLEISGAENIPATGPALLVFNQVSILDSPLMTMLGPRRDVTGLVARDYRSNPFYRIVLGWGGTIWIRRCSSDHTALKSALDALSQGWVVAISPEGRRSPTGGLVAGKSGAAFLAKQSGVQVVPVAITNTGNVAASLLRFRRETVRVRIGAPFALAPFNPHEHRSQLREDTNAIMAHLASLLPPECRGIYANHLNLGSALATGDCR